MVVGSGRGLGDNIEHLWAGIRPHAIMLKRMSPAGHAELIDQLVRCCCFPACLCRQVVLDRHAKYLCILSMCL